MQPAWIPIGRKNHGTCEQVYTRREGWLGASGDFTIAIDVWLSALKRLQQVLGASREDTDCVVLMLRYNELRLLCAGIELVVPAEGEGEGQAVFDVAQLQRLATVARFLRPKTVRVWVSEGILRIDSTAIDCEWVEENGTARSAILPARASLVQILQLRYRHQQSELVLEGLDGRVFEAECKKAELVARGRNPGAVGG